MTRTGDVLDFHFAHHRVRLVSNVAEVLASLDAIFGGARSDRSRAPSTCFSVERHGTGARVTHDGELLETTTPIHDVVPLIETRLYRSLWQTTGAAVLHAAAVVRDSHVLLFVGPSGAGKSSFALAAVRAGLDYVADEITLSDGTRVWGVGRAIQFDPQPVEARTTGWLTGADTESYRFVDALGRARSLPFFDVTRKGTRVDPVCFERIDLVHLRRGSVDRVARCSPIESLRRTLGAAYLGGGVDFGAFAARGWILEWSDPQSAWELVERAVLVPAA